MTTDQFLSRLQGSTKTGSGWTARCPAHDDTTASLSVATGNDGCVLVKCHAGCGVDQIVEAIGLSKRDLFPDQPNHKHHSRITDTYDYTDEEGQRLYQVVRLEPKSFRQRRPDPSASDGWNWKLGDVRRALYRMPKIIAAVNAGHTIFVVEGEKDVAALVDHGFDATCNAGGAVKWLDDYTTTLHGADVVLIADKDTAGRKHVQLVASKLHGDAESVRIAELPDFNNQPVKDAADYFDAGATADDFNAVIAEAPVFATASTPPAPKPVLADPDDGVDEDTPEPFPIHCLPPDIALIAHAVATTHQVPVALPAMIALATVAASIGRGLVLDWRPGKSPTPAGLYVLPGAGSGSGKSECSKQLLEPYNRFEREMQERWQREVQPKIQAELRVQEIQIKKLERKLGQSRTSPEEFDHSSAAIQFHLARITELKGKLHEPQLSIQDATVEKVATVMHDNDEIIFSQSADGRKLVDNILGRYSSNKKLADDGIYLSAFSGDNVKVDRLGRDGVRLANPCLTLLWALQPDALDMLLGEESLQQGGFLARCLMAHTHAEPQHIGGDLRPISEDSRRRWETLIRSLLVTYRQPSSLPASEVEQSVTL